jgi:small-conductance mechanosensitive channel
LEAGGALGIIGLVLAMTQAAWAPDIISGLIILNSRFCQDGDVIQFTMDGKEIIASIFKTKLFHTECLDLANNHRIMVRNAKLRDFGLQNLSRFASAKGLRECLTFNIDYQHSQQEVSDMIQRAFDKIDMNEGAREEQYEPEIMVLDTGDYAIKWAVYYYIKDVRKLLYIRQLFRAYILKEAVASNISLATPTLQTSHVQITQ